MKIELAKIDDLQSIIGMYEACKNSMKEQQIIQWTESYPNAAILKQDIKNDSLFTIKENQLLMGAIVLNSEQDIQYSKIKWRDSTGPSLVVHRLAVDPKHQNKGIANTLMDYAESYASTNKYKSIRLDAFNGNSFALKLYLKRMYEKRGELYFRNLSIPFSCFEKQII